MSIERDLEEAVALELDELVAMGDAEMITEQGLRKVHEAEQRGELN